MGKDTLFSCNPKKISNFAATLVGMSTIHINASSRSAIVSNCSEVFFDDFFSKNAIGRNGTNNYIQGISNDFSVCSFTGKERDEETGYGYFGARYMDHELMSMWLSVDPLADKYPSISPYAYCAWNPVKLVDSDGRKIYILTGDGRRITYSANMQPVGDKASYQQIAVLNEMYRTGLGRTLIKSLKKSSKEFWISNEETGTRQTCATIAYKNGSTSKMGGNNNIRDLSHELFHALQFKAGQGGTTYHNEVEAFSFSAALINEYSKLNNPKEFPSTMSALLSMHPNTDDGKRYENAMSHLQSRTFDQKSFDAAVNLFKTESGANETGVYNTNYTTRTGKERPLLELFYPLK